MTNHKTRPSNAIDPLIGQQLRMARKMAGMTQLDLGDILGLSAQQIQKYEAGQNRISAGTLYHLAKAVGQPVLYFYESTPLTHSKDEAKELRLALATTLVSIQDTNKLSALLKMALVLR